MMQTTEFECPLCMEQLEIDDVNFFPCTCGYQICRFCWHRIRTDENGLCPACRKPYSEDPAVYTPLSHEEIQRILKERKQKDVQRKQKVTENRKHLANVRVVQKNLVFVVGLTQRLADPELLKRPEYFSKFGKIHKIVVNNSTNYAGPQGPSASAYITYAREEDAIKAIIAVCNTHLDGRTLKASLGTTKYCSYFLRNIPCPKPDCMYLHELGDGAGSFTKEDMQSGKHQEYEQQLITFYSRKMEFNVDKGTREDWPAGGTNESAVATCLPTGAAWAGKGEDSEEGTKLPQNHTQNKESVTPVCNEDWEQNLDTPKRRFSTRAAHEHSAQLPRNNTGWEKTENPSRGLESNTSLFPSDHYSGLGLSNLHLKVYGEDDLGFDPWNECSKGLADLLQEEEKTTKPGTAATNTQSYLSSFQRDGSDIRNWQDGLRALLPNINISFTDSLASRQQGTWPSTTSYVADPRSSNWSASVPQPQTSWQVRPPPGFEPKSPTNHMPMADDPSILWSKTVDSEALHINKSIPRPFPNGFPGVHSLTRPTDLQGTAAASPKNKVMSQLTTESLQKSNHNTDARVTSFAENREAYARGTDELLVKRGKCAAGERCHSVTTLSGLSALEQRTRVSELSVIQLDDPLYQPSQGIHHQQHNHLENRQEGGPYQETKKQQEKNNEEETNGKDTGEFLKLQQVAPKSAGYDQQEQTDIVKRRKNSKGMSASLHATNQRKNYLSSTMSGGSKRFPDGHHQGNKPMHVSSQKNSLQSYTIDAKHSNSGLAGLKGLPARQLQTNKREVRDSSVKCQPLQEQKDSVEYRKATCVLDERFQAFLNGNNLIAECSTGEPVKMD